MSPLEIKDIVSDPNENHFWSSDSHGLNTLISHLSPMCMFQSSYGMEY